MKAFRLAPMSPAIAALTAVLMFLPVAFIAAARLVFPALLLPGILLVAIYAWIWLWFRPTRFEVTPTALEIVWPLRRVSIPRADIAEVRVLSGKAMREEIGWGLRVGAGGMWGGFGWLYTRDKGKVRFYISRTDDLVWIGRKSSEPWLLTPGDPKGFARALESRGF